MRGVIVVLACVIATPAMAQQTDSTSGATLQVNLDEAVRRALQVQPAIVQAIGSQRNAGASERSAWGSFLPSLTVGASTATSGGTQINQATNQIVPAGRRSSYSGNFAVNLDLFDGFARIATVNAASASAGAADAGYVNQRFQVTLTTKQLFYDAVANEELVGVAESQLREAQQQLDISVQKLRAGSATRSDSLRSVLGLGNAQLALLQAQANLATAQANLGRQIGADEQVRAIPDTMLAPLPDTAELRQEAVDRAPLVIQREAEARSARAQVRVARSSYLPKLSASYSNGMTGRVLDTLLNNWQLRFSVSLPLFNGFTREQQLVQANVQQDIAQALAADARRQVGAQLTQQIAALGTAYTQIEISAANVAAATEDLRVQQERYRVGASIFLDLLTSEATLTQAKTNEVQARFNYLIARAQLEALVGHSL